MAQAFDRWQVDGVQGEAALKMGDGTALHLRVACPQGAVRTVLLLLHGAGMHSGHYQTIGRLLATHGHLVLMPDQRGHGQSEGARGDIIHHDVYCDDIAWMLQRIKMQGLPIVLVAHSGAAAMSVRVLAEATTLQVAGFAMLTPTFADDGALVRRNSGGRDYGTYLRYMLKPAPEPEVKIRAPANMMLFRFGTFLLHRLTGLRGNTPVLTYQSSVKNEPPYTYTARGVRGSMIGRADLLLARLRCPIFLATGGQDSFVNSDAVRTLLPWLIAPEASLQTLHETRGDHFTTLLLSVQPLLKWLNTRVLEPAQKQERI